jgi:hypothetical protein
MRRIFIDSQLEKEFNRNGFVKIKFLEGKTLLYLRDFYENNFSNDEKHIDKVGYNKEYTEFSVIDFAKDSRKLCFHFIQQQFESALTSILYNYKPVIGNFITKHPGKGILPLHQNWSLVNEHFFTSVSVWFPLQDSESFNGTLKILRGSHKFFRGFRIAESHERFLGISDQFKDKFLEDIQVKSGEAIILDDSLIHGSNINQSGNRRIAVQQILIPDEIPEPFFCFRNPDNPEKKGLVYQVNNNFFFDMKDLKGDVDNFPLIRDFDIDNTPITDDILEQLIVEFNRNE